MLKVKARLQNMLLLIDSGRNTGNTIINIAGKNIYERIKRVSGKNAGNFAGKIAGKS